MPCRCEHCNSIISRTRGLKRHQLSKKCLEIRLLKSKQQKKEQLEKVNKINSEIKFVSKTIITKNVDDNLTFVSNFSKKHILEVVNLINTNTIINETGLSDLYINKIAKNKNGEYGIINTNKINPVFHIRKKDGTIEKDIGGKLIFKRFISMSTDKINNYLKEIEKNKNIDYTIIEKNIKNYNKFIKNISYELHIDNIKNNINKDEYWDKEDEKNNESKLKFIITEEKCNDKNNFIENTLNEYKLEKSDEFLLIVSKIRKSFKKKKITHILATQVWDKYIGMEIGQIKCPVCKVNEINQRNFECGHVIPESKGGETKLDNLRPLCNKSIGTNEMDKTIWNNIKSN